MLSFFASTLDAWLYRGPFEGSSARRYARDHRPGFGDLDHRLIAGWHGELAAAGTVLDVGAGPGHFAAHLAAAHPQLVVVALEPSADFAGPAPHRRAAVVRVRARAERLPLASGSIGLAVCLSSIRHVRDRVAALCELRRVVAGRGAAYIVELDPSASARRIRGHGRGLASRRARLVFGPLVVKTAPPAEAITALARRAGWARVATCADPLQPFYVMRLSA